ncbi:MAG: hypothetical protein NVS1B11_23160 [Terriglobales bacterium]
MFLPERILSYGPPSSVVWDDSKAETLEYFSVNTLLESIGEGRTIVPVPKKHKVMRRAIHPTPFTTFRKGKYGLLSSPSRGKKRR